MAKRFKRSPWSKAFSRGLAMITRQALRAGRPVAKKAPRRVTPLGNGTWTSGMAVGARGARRFRLYRPPNLRADERVPLLVMLHGCGQDAQAFALSTRMNTVAARGRFMVLYPEQDRLAHAQGCWHWYDTGSGRAQAEAASIHGAIAQVCRQHPVDRQRIAIAGLSAGASMAGLMATLYPQSFKAVAMHSGIPPGAAHSTLSALGAMRGRRTQAPWPIAAAAGRPALLVIHGQLDGVVAPSNGRAAAQGWAGAMDDTRIGKPRDIQRGCRHPMTVTDFKGPDGATVSTLVEVARLGHAWSGGAASQPFSDGQGPDASRMLWAFVTKQFKPGLAMPRPGRENQKTAR